MLLKELDRLTQRLHECKIIKDNDINLDQHDILFDNFGNYNLMHEDEVQS